MDDDTGDALPTALAATVAQGKRSPSESGDMPTMVDRFLIEDELGAGGMGRVYMAYDPTLDRKVAIKLLRHEFGFDNDKAQARMAREARAMARLRHPHVVTVHEVGTHEGSVFIVMEYVEGGTLRDWLDRTPAATWKQIVAMYTLAGHGLAAAHQAGLVHRDFKPDNVLVGDDGRVLVSDFGIANVHEEPDEPVPAGRDTPPRLTRAGSVIGTPPYMSPEQHRGKPVDARTDQFAFCAALYEALYGVRPFDGPTHTEIADHAIRGVMAPPERDPGVPKRIHAAILRGLRSDPAQRFPSMHALLAELGTEKRSRAPWIALGLAAVAIGGIVTWQLTRASDAPAASEPIGTIAVESFDITIQIYAGRGEWREGVADIVAMLLADIDGIKATGPTMMLGPDGVREAHASPKRPDFRAAEAKANAAYIVGGKIEEQRDRVHATVTVTRPDGSRVATFEIDRPRRQLAKLLEDVAEGVAKALDPSKSLPREQPTRARALLTLGDEPLRVNDFQMAWPYLEQAVASDPKLFEAWYALAMVRTWVLAPESQQFEAIDGAIATAPTPLRKRLVEGVGKHVRHDLPGARAILEPLIDTPGLSKIELRDALYFLGEAHWHDGHHKIGAGFFRRALELDFKFKLPAQHLGEYATANRDLPRILEYSSMIATASTSVHDRMEFLQGHYETVATETNEPTLRLQAELMLGREPTVDVPKVFEHGQIEIHTYRATRALELGQVAVAHAEIEELWKEVALLQQAGELPDNTYYSLRQIGDLMLCANMTEDVRRLVTFLAKQSIDHPVRSYQRLSILAAPLLGDKTLIVRRNLTDRDRVLADAIEAEMSGDRAKAVELLTAIVKDPSPYWDFPERMALLRNLRALGRAAEAKALCEDTLKPALFQWSFVPSRKACKG